MFKNKTPPSNGIGIRGQSCFDCGTDISHRNRQALYCFNCCRKHKKEAYKKSNPQLTFSPLAHAYVSRAIALGILPALDGTIKCSDCENKATQYDHRDYSRPLDVSPVCRSCNKKRGSALYKIDCTGVVVEHKKAPLPYCQKLYEFISDRHQCEKLAKHCNTKPIYLRQIALGHRKASTKLALAIDSQSAAIGPQKVPKESLRPDVWQPEAA